MITFSLFGHVALQTLSTNKNYWGCLMYSASYNTSGRFFAISINHSQSQLIKLVYMSSINEGHPTDISICKSALIIVLLAADR